MAATIVDVNAIVVKMGALDITGFADGEAFSHDFDDESTANLYEFDWQPISLDELQDAPEGVTSAVACTFEARDGATAGGCVPHGKLAA